MALTFSQSFQKYYGADRNFMVPLSNGSSRKRLPFSTKNDVTRFRSRMKGASRVSSGQAMRVDISGPNESLLSEILYTI